MFSEGGEDKLTDRDFRFVTKGQVLYATAMGWPDSGKYTIRTLAAGLPGIKGDVANVEMLGAGKKLRWIRSAEGLEVELPAAQPCDHAWVLKIEGLDLAGSEPVAPV
jgi:alpha-L-fucosidase